MNCAYLCADIVGRFSRLIGERFYFRSDDSKAAACFAGTRGFDRCVKRQQIGLAGNVGNELNDFTDMLRCLGQAAHGFGRALRFGDGVIGDARGFGDLPADFAAGDGEVFGGSGNGLNIGRSLFGGGGDGIGLS